MNMPIVRPTTKGELYWWKDTRSFLSGYQKGDRRTDMYVMEAIVAGKKSGFSPSNPMAYRIAFYVSSTLKDVRMVYTQHGRYSSGIKSVTLSWSFKSKKAANEWYSKIKRRVTSATTFNALMNQISLLRRNMRKHKRTKRG